MPSKFRSHNIKVEFKVCPHPKSCITFQDTTPSKHRHSRQRQHLPNGRVASNQTGGLVCFLHHLEQGLWNAQETNKFNYYTNSFNKILSLPSSHSSSTSILSQSLPPPLDYPPCLAIVSNQPACRARTRTISPTTSHVHCLWRVEDCLRRARCKTFPCFYEQEGHFYGLVSYWVCETADW